MSRMLTLYPRAWRERYEIEFRALMAARPPGPRDRLDIVRGGIDARLHPQVGPGLPADGALSTPARLVAILAVAGGALWIAGGFAFYNAWYNPGLGYKDSGFAVLIATAGALVTGIAAALVSRSSPGRSVVLSTAATGILLGAVVMTQPWPFVFLGYYSVVFGTVAFGLLVSRRLGPTGIVLGVAALPALFFNTEDERALVLISLGAAWLLVGIVLAFRGLPSATNSETPADGLTAPGPASLR
jgi:hypothetical protein